MSGKGSYVALLAGLAALGFLFTLNPNQVTFRLYPGAAPVETNLALVLFLAFLSGFVAAFLSGLLREGVFGLRFWFHRRAEARREEGRRLFAEGRGRLAEGRARLAAGVLRKAHRRLPDDAVVALELARAELAQGKADLGERRLKALVEDHPGNPEALGLLLDFYHSRGDDEAEAGVLSAWLAADPDHRPALAGLRELYRRRESWGEAVRVQEKLLARTSGREARQRERRRLSELALLASRGLEPGRAAAELRRVLDDDRGFAEAHGALGDALAAQGDEQGAVRAWEKGFEATGEKALLLKAEEVSLRRGSADEMLKIYKKLGRKDPAGALLRARLLLALNRPEEALEAAEKAEAGTARSAAGRWLAGEALFRLRSYDGAARAFRESRAADQGVPPLEYRCRGCGRTGSRWDYACPGCGAVGGLRLDLGATAGPLRPEDAP